jgi:hypothetical protein
VIIIPSAAVQDKSSTLDYFQNKILRICASFSASVYPFPETEEDFDKTKNEIKNRLEV